MLFTNKQDKMKEMKIFFNKHTISVKRNKC